MSEAPTDLSEGMDWVRHHAAALDRHRSSVRKHRNDPTWVPDRLVRFATTAMGRVSLRDVRRHAWHQELDDALEAFDPGAEIAEALFEDDVEWADAEDVLTFAFAAACQLVKLSWDLMMLRIVDHELRARLAAAVLALAVVATRDPLPTLPPPAPTDPSVSDPPEGPVVTNAPPCRLRGIEGAAPARSASTLRPDLTPEGLAA